MEKGNSINDLVGFLIKPFAWLTLDKWVEQTYLIKNCDKSVVNEVYFLKLLKKSVVIPKLRNAVLEVLCHTNKDTITESVFNFCLKYPGKFRKTLLIQLSHMWLDVDQLLILNKLLDTPEAFCKLLVYYTQNTSTTAEELLAFLHENRGFMKQVNCLEILKQCNVETSPDKYFILIETMKKTGDGSLS